MSQGPIRLGPLLLTRPIGRGGMGTVWHARHPEGVDVAVKVVRPEYSAEPEQAEAFRREVRSVAFLDHPGIVRVYDFGVVPEAVAEASGDRLPPRGLWLSMEFAEAGTLGDQSQLTSWSELRDTLVQILSALSHGHARGIVHRDLKPRNVLVHAQGRDGAAPEPDGAPRQRVSLTDYGIAHALHREGADRAQAGTPGYMAPEQIRGDWRDLGSWTDLYSLGSLAWRLATGRSPFAGDRAPAVLFAQLNGRMRQFEPQLAVPAGFDEWVARLLQVEPTQRYACAADAADELVALDRGAAPSGRGRSHDHVPRDWRPRQPPTVSRPKGTGLALFVYRPWPLVGREALQDTLWNAFRAVASTGRAQVLVLSGNAGVGKTRLATWLTERVTEIGAAWALRPPPERAARAAARQGSGAYARPGVALPSAVRRLLRLDELAAEDEHRRLVTALADRGSPEPEMEASEVAGLLDRAFVLGQVMPRTLTPDEESNRKWLWFFERLAHDRPLVVFVEHLHVEPQACALLAALHGTRRPVLAIATLDRTAQAPHAAAIRQLCEQVQTLHIDALDADQHRAMIDVGVGLCNRLAEQVVERTLGDLSLTVRLVTDWVRRSLLVPTSNGFDLRDGTDPRLTESICEDLAARIDGLGAHRTEQISFLAALAPKRVRHDEWTEVCAAADRPLRPEAIQAFDERGLLVIEQAADGPRYTLAPQALREAILYRATEQKQLERIHTLCAGVLVATPKASAHERAVMHFHAAGLSDVALHHLRELIDRTMGESQWRRVPGLLAYERQLLDQLGVPASDSRRFRNQVDELVTEERTGGETDLEATRSILSRTAANGDPATSARLARIILRAEARSGTLRHDDLLLIQARRWAQAAGDTASQLEIVRLSGEAAWRRMDVPLAEGLLSEAADLAEDPEDRIALLALLGEVRGLSGSVEQGAVLVARALELALRGGSRRGLAHALISQSILSRHRGDASGAHDLAQRATIELEELGADPLPAELQLGLALLGVRDTDAARGLLERVLAADDQDRRVVAAAGLLACAAGEAEGPFDAALAEWRRAAEGDHGYHPDTVWPLEWAARIAVDEGHIDRAAVLFRQAAVRYQRLGDPAAAERVERERRALSSSSPGR